MQNRSNINDKAASKTKTGWGGMFKKKRAEHYIRIYCDYFDADQRNREIALESPNILGTLVDHLGELPSGSGYFHDVLTPRIDKMRKIHPDYEDSQKLLRLLTKKQAWCVLSWGSLVKRRPEKKVLKTVKDVAEYLDSIIEGGVNYDCYKRTRRAGIDRINAELGILIA